MKQIVIASFLLITQLLVSGATLKINDNGNWDDSPFISADGQHLYFMSNPYDFWPVHLGGQPVFVGPARPGHRSSTNPWDDSNVYVADRLTATTWRQPRSLYVGCCAMTNDGVVFYTQKTAPGGANQDLYAVIFQNGVASPVWLGANVNTTSQETNPHFRVDGTFGVFASDRPGGYGGYDLYGVSHNPDGTYSAAWNLGPNVNTAANEDQPWLSADGLTVVWNADLQIYKSVIQANGWGPRYAINVGMPAGSPVAEASFSTYHGAPEVFFVFSDQVKKMPILMRATLKTAPDVYNAAAPID